MRRVSNAPHMLATVTEGWRLSAEFGASVLWGARVDRLIKRNNIVGNGAPVLTIPGFMAPGGSLLPLQKFLAKQGHAVYDWDQSFNFGPVHCALDDLVKKVEALYEEHGRPVNLIGQSLGGVYAHKVAADLRDTGKVGRIITLGSPINAAFFDEDGENVNAGARFLFDKLNPPDHSEVKSFMVSMEEIVRDGLPGVPVTCVYSHSDGVVGASASQTDLVGQQKENIGVTLASHIGMGMHPVIRLIIADRLAQEDGRSIPFNPTKYPAFVRGLIASKSTVVDEASLLPRLGDGAMA